MKEKDFGKSFTLGLLLGYELFALYILCEPDTSDLTVLGIVLGTVVRYVVGAVLLIAFFLLFI